MQDSDINFFLLLLLYRWVVLNSELVVDNPCLLCERCFRNTHYDEQNKKIGKFEAYHFSQFI